MVIAPLARLVRSVGFRFAAVSLVPIIALGWFVDSSVRTAIETRTGDVYGGMSSLMFRMVSGYLVTPEDFEPGATVPPERARLVDDVLAGFGASHDNARIVFAAPDGHVVYANRPEDRARLVPRTEPFERALAGRRSTLFVRDSPHTFAGDGRVIELYLPVRLGDGPEADEVRGVLVASGIDGSLIDVIDRDVRRMKWSLAAGLVALWVVLLPISSSVSRRLRRKSEENEHLALHDTLTGLPNRNLLAARLSAEIGAIDRSGGGVGLLLIDLDRFKEVNDTLGHTHGDELLVAVADRLTDAAGPDDMVARLGGDEFAIVAHGITTAAELEAVAARVTEALTGATAVAGVGVAVQASIGGALYPAQAADAEALLRHADIAMYAAKHAGLGFVAYSAEIDSHSPSRLALAAELLTALDRHELVLDFQPIASPVTGEVVSMEALVRWNHPVRGVLPPSEFIPLAEQSGIVRQVTVAVIDQALHAVACWRAAGRDISVSVNLSANDLRTTAIVDEVDGLLRRHRLPAGVLELEVTETAFLEGPDAALVVRGLRSLGVRIALDDFGTGFSSLTYLKQLRPDRLKIDRSFVNSMTRDETDAHIVRSVIELAHSLSIGVTAEGVETAEHWALLAELACDLVQGYHLSRPLPADAVERWLATRAVGRAMTSEVIAS